MKLFTIRSLSGIRPDFFVRTNSIDWAVEHFADLMGVVVIESEKKEEEFDGETFVHVEFKLGNGRRYMIWATRKGEVE